MKQQKLVIIIPTYNEAANIENTIHKIRENTQNVNDLVINILVFDSASTDGTAAKVKELMQQDSQLFFVAEPQKSGLGSAYAQAMRYAIEQMQADLVFEYDADGSHNPKYIAPMLARIQNSADVVLGSRYVPGGSIPAQWAWHRKFLSKFGNHLARFFLFTQYHDYTSGFRVSRAKFLKPIYAEGFISNGYAYKFQVFCNQHILGARIEEHPIEFVDREKGVSKLPRNSIIESLKVLFILRWRLIKNFFRSK